MTDQREDSTEAIKQAFVAGWKIGYYDGHEHECRMFPPTAERAWDDYQREQKGQVKEPR